MGVSLVIGTIILAFTIFFGEDNEVAAKPAYIAALIVMVILVLIIFPVENWIMAQGFSLEDSEDSRYVVSHWGLLYWRSSN